jgi:signal transduction histidine kinase/DNA-binding NarL/FixJ family response regulator
VTLRLNDLPIRRKLTLITMVSSMVALTLACAAFVIHDVATSRDQMVKDWSSHADIVGNNSTAALGFRLADDAQSNLDSLGVEPHLTDAAIYDADGTLFASFSRGGDAGAVRPEASPTPGHVFRNKHLELTRPILLDGKPFGTIYVRANLETLDARVLRYAVITVLVLAGSATVAYLLVVWLQPVITEPVVHLAETARTISAEKNYAVRAVKRGNDELGALIDCFNEMLLQIQQRDVELTLHREHLEEQVASRTEELRNVNAQLVVEKDRAEEASRAKSAFLANMSHEIRTPMTAILGYTEMMLEPDQTPAERHDHLQTIRRNARHLMDLINDILDISKIEAGKMTVERIPFDLPQLVGEVVSLMRPRARQKGLRCCVTVAGAVPRIVKSDPLRLRQILVNLIGNAIKFTSNGSISVRISCADQVGGRLRVTFAIEDSGIGIDAEQIGRLFQPFTQADSSTTRRFGGTGLGLAISHRLAQLLGGDITARSTLGAGSTFVLTIDGGDADGVTMLSPEELSLPDDLAKPETGAAEPATATPPAAVTQSIADAHGAAGEAPAGPVTLRGRILLAEDGPDNQVLISTHLRKAGAQVVIAGDGKVALALALRERFDLVVMDMQMPNMDGYQATRELRRRGFTGPIVALTAHAMAGDREKCIRAGCTDYLSKPIEKARLLATIHHYLNDLTRRGSSTATAAGQVTPASPAEAPVATAQSDEPGLTPPTEPAPESLPGAVLVSSFKDDPDLTEVLGRFVETLPHRVQKLTELLAHNDLAELGRIVHQMKGASGGYGFAILSKLAAKAEQKIKSKEPLEAVAADVNELIAMIRRVEGYVEPPGRGTPKAAA